MQVRLRILNQAEKIIEIRLFDEKRQKVNLGDTITFSKLPDLDEQITVKVVALLCYKTFAELVDDFSMDYFGYPEDYDKGEFVESIYTVYTKEQEAQHDVLGIKIMLL